MNCDNEIKVSILCLVYNQAQYLRQCLDGFIMQKTSFAYEVIVHDDASTDNSAEIIREYAERYPEIIKPVCQTENQYSQSIGITKTILMPMAKGKYIALCEGDDYWIDERKLQKQFDYCEENEKCTFCFTNAFCEEGGIRTRKVIPWAKDSIISDNGVYDMQQIEELNYIPTASFFFRRECYLKLPEIDENAFKGDGYIKLGITMQGYAYCIPDETCVYRFKVRDSATSTWVNSIAAFHQAAFRFSLMYREFDRITDGRFTETFQKRAFDWEMADIVKTGDYMRLKDSAFHSYYNKLRGKQKVKYWLGRYFPFLLYKWYKIKK